MQTVWCDHITRPIDHATLFRAVICKSELAASKEHICLNCLEEVACWQPELADLVPRQSGGTLSNMSRVAGLMLVVLTTAAFRRSVPRIPGVFRAARAAERLSPDPSLFRGSSGSRVRFDEYSDFDTAFMEAFEEGLSKVPPEAVVGDLVTGRVTAITPRGLRIDAKGPAAFLLPWGEVSMAPLPPNVEEIFSVGQTVTAKMITTDRETPILSTRILEFRAIWKELGDCHKNGSTVEVTVNTVNRGGAVCSFRGVAGFLPVAQCISVPTQSDIGETLRVLVMLLYFLFECHVHLVRQVHVLSCYEQSQKVLFGMKNLSLRGDKSQAVKPVVQIGSLISATVIRHSSYGVFLRIFGWQTGMLHKSMISNAPVTNLPKLFPVGTKIKAVISNKTTVNGKTKIELCTKVLETNPGDIIRNSAQVFLQASKAYQRYFVLNNLFWKINYYNQQ
jgi:predicted RNA-binding protein with RPS1 domain